LTLEDAAEVSVAGVSPETNALGVRRRTTTAKLPATAANPPP